MNDVMTSLDAGCGLFVKIAIGIALLSFSWVCAAFAKQKRGPAVLASTTITTSTGQPPVVAAPLQAPRVRVIAKPEPAPEPVEVLECGNCGKEIHSEPVSQVMEPEPAELYQCESCGAKVRVPV